MGPLGPRRSGPIAPSVVCAAHRIGLALVLLVSTAAAAEPWPTTNFEVFPGPPISREWGDSGVAEYLDHIPTLSSVDFPPAMRRQLEAALSRIARRYQSMGLPAPRLEPIVTTEDGAQAYRIYVCKKSWLDKAEDSVLGENPFEVSIGPLPTLRSIWEACGEVAMHYGGCGETQGLRNVLYFNSEELLDGPRMDGWDYATAAHELFHAVHAGMASWRGDNHCQVGEWITEGLADAVSIDLVRDLWPEVSMKALGDPKQFGLRDYSKGLPHSEDPYYTSSFWRHIGEWYHAALSNRGRRAGSALTHSDYEFLVRLLDRPIEGVGFRPELKWLEEGLRSTPGLATNTARIYANFTAAVADQLRTRKILGYACRDKPAGTSGCQPPARVPAGRLQNWLDSLFGDCPEVKLSASQPVASKAFAINAAAARCFKVEVQSTLASPAPKHTVVTMTAGPATRDQLSALWIGKSGGFEVSPLRIYGGNERASKSPDYATAQFEVEVGGRPGVFVLSNMAHYAQNSLDQDPTLKFMIPGWNSTVTKPPPAKNLPTKGKAPAKKPQDPKGQREEQLQKQAGASLGQLTSLGPGTLDIRRDFRPRPGCSGWRLRYNLCGPQLDIDLQLTTAAAATLSGAAPGGPAGQITGNISPLGQMAMAEMMALARWGAELNPSQIEGGEIAIRIPKVDYGFQGEFSNAVIEVSREGGGHYVAETPAYQVVATTSYGIPVRRRLPNGKVTIHEYSPLLLRGEFEAALLDEDVADRHGTDEVAPVAKRISGEFVIPNAFAHDDDFELDKTAFLRQGTVATDPGPMMNAPANLQPGKMLGPAMVERLCAFGVDDHLLQAMGFEGGCPQTGGGGPSGPTGSASAARACDCSCAERDSERGPVCEPRCRAEYDECAAGEGGDSDDIEHLRALLKRSYYPPSTHAELIETYQALNAEQRREYMKNLQRALRD